MLKWFWNSIDFKNWTFEGYKLKNPIIILWRTLISIPIILWRMLISIPIIIFKYVYLFFVLIGYGAYTAKMQRHNIE